MRRKLLLVLSLMLVIIGCAQLYTPISNYVNADITSAQLQQKYTTEVTTQTSARSCYTAFLTSMTGLDFLDVDFDAISNNDIVGWLQSETISLPIVQTTNNEYYLHRNIYGEYLYAGTLFVDYRNNFLQDNVTWIYGHSMKNGSMFGSLTKYDDYEYWLNHKYMRLYTKDGIYNLTVDIPGVYTDAFDDYFVYDENSFNSAMTRWENMSVFNTGESYSRDSKYIGFYQCAYRIENGRRFMLLKIDKLF